MFFLKVALYSSEKEAALLYFTGFEITFTQSIVKDMTHNGYLPCLHLFEKPTLRFHMG